MACGCVGGSDDCPSLDDFGVEIDDGTIYPRCGPYCGLQVVRPGKVQCECDYDSAYDAFDAANAANDWSEREQD